MLIGEGGGGGGSQIIMENKPGTKLHAEICIQYRNLKNILLAPFYYYIFIILIHM